MDALGYPVRLVLTAAQVFDITRAVEMVAEWLFGFVVVNKGYDADRFIATIEKQERSLSSRPSQTAEIGNTAIRISKRRKSG